MPVQEQRRIQDYYERLDVSSGDRTRPSELVVTPFTTLPHVEIKDFPLRDPWSLLMRSVLAQARDDGVFDGHELTEFGVGDARNIIVAAGNRSKEEGGITHIRALDIDGWRATVGFANLRNNPATAQTPTDVQGDIDAVAYLNDWKANSPHAKLHGNVIACLPQSPDGENAADRYEQSPLLADYAKWDKYSLTLNAAVLGNLREVVAGDVRLFLMLSDRVPSGVREEMIHETGWEIANEHKTEVPIQQDPDTGIGWVSAIDDGQRFYEFVDGEFHFLPAKVAEERRLKSLEGHTERESLNVYHHLSVYELQPTRPVVFEIFKSVSPNGNRNGDGLVNAA